MKLYIYDHCPYCVRARMIFGMKKLPVETITLLNDDEKTPISLVGKKVVPILIKDDGEAMPESLDIVRYVDAHFGTPLILAGTKNNQTILSWVEASREYVYKLCMPRWIDAPLAEFETEKSRIYFAQKKEAAIGSFATHLKNSKDLIHQANVHLRELTPHVLTSSAVHGILTEDDFILFPVLRSLTIVNGIKFSDNIDTYIRRMSELTKVPLYFNIAS
jgi:glutaredoxin 2